MTIIHLQKKLYLSLIKPADSTYMKKFYSTDKKCKELNPSTVVIELCIVILMDVVPDVVFKHRIILIVYKYIRYGCIHQ